MIKRKKNKSGFTLAELLVVVAIIGILVAISIPIFTAQRAKAVRATNQANIRAAKAMALNELYGGRAEYQAYVTSTVEKRRYTYFVYNVKEAKITEVFTEKDIHWNTINPRGQGLREKALKNQVCDEILVYIEIGNADERGNLDVQTAPFYDADGNVGALEGASAFGPR